MPLASVTTIGASALYLAGTWLRNMSGGSTTWSSMLTRIRSSLFMPQLVPSDSMTVSALSDRGLAETAKIARPVIELRRGGRAMAGSYLYEGDGLITGWHSHEVHQIEYAMHGVVEVETDSAHYLLPPQQAAWIPVGLEHQAVMNPDVKTVAVMFDPQLIADAGDRARIIAVSPLIRELMIYALRWPIERVHGDETSDGF